MKHLALTTVFGVAAVVTWRIIDTMSADALAMAVGMVLGMGAGIPAAVLLLISRHRRVHSVGQYRQGVAGHGYGMIPTTHHTQPPVVVIAPPGFRPSQAGFPAAYHSEQGLPHPPHRRRFVVVGQTEPEEW